MNCLVKVKMSGAILASLILIISLPGCYDQREIDDLAYPIAVGLDVGEANILRMTLQLAAPIAIGGGGGGESGGGGGGGESEPTSVITVDTPSIYTGLNLINNIISKEINLSHAKTIIISKKLAEQGVSHYIQALQRGREFRPDMFILISNESSAEYLEKVKPLLESNPAKYYELLLGSDYSSFFPEVRVSDFHFANESDAMEPVAILTGLNRNDSVDSLGEIGGGFSTPRHVERYKAGNIPIVSGQKNVVMGTAVFKNGKLAGTLNGAESVCHQLVTGKFRYSYLTIPDVYDEKSMVVMDIFQRNRPSIKTELKDGRAVVNITLDLESDFVSIQSRYEHEDFPQAMEKKAADLIKREVSEMLEKTAREFDSDICGIGRYVKGRFLTMDDWERFNWSERYKHSEFNVEVRLKVRRTGLIIKSMQK